MLFLIENDLLILDEFEFIELNNHMFFELVPELLDLFLFVRVVFNFVLLFEDPLNLSKLIAVFIDCTL